MLSLVIESALRSMVMGIAVGLLLKLLRVRNPHVQLTAWSLVLLASLAMPLLSQLMTIATPVPAIVQVVSMDSIAMAPSVAPDWRWVALSVYLAVAGVLLARQLAGVVRGWQIRGRAIAIHEPWAGTMDVRVSAEIGAPATFSSTVLLPVNHEEWSAVERQAVLAHEGTHVRNLDFHLQLLARIHRAVFWFSPFSWWLARKLPLIGEDLSDDAAIGAIGDRFGYARMLIEFARRPHELPAGVAMARPSTVAVRIERVLADRYRLRGLSLIRRMLVAIAVLPAIIGAAAASTHGVDDTKTSGVDDTKPKSNLAYPLSQPPYPPQSRDSREQGTVIMDLFVLEDGSVSDVKIYKSSGFPRLDYSAANEVFSWQLDPGTADGRPAPTWGRFAVTFKMAD